MFSSFLLKFKRVLGVKNDSAVATALGIKKAKFSNLKKEGKIPHQEVFLYCLERSINYRELVAISHEV